MSPFQHGEVFVTDDGAETDLDLATSQRLHHDAHAQVTTSPAARSTRPCWRRSVAATTRQDGAGDPARHQRDRGTSSAARAWACRRGRRGHRRDRRHGGRHQSLPFLEAVCQMALKLGPQNAAFVHLTYGRGSPRPASSRPSPPSTRCRRCARSASSPTRRRAAPTAHPARRARRSACSPTSRATA